MRPTENEAGMKLKLWFWIKFKLYKCVDLLNGLNEGKRLKLDGCLKKLSVRMWPTVEYDGLKLKLWFWRNFKWYRNSF